MDPTISRSIPEALKDIVTVQSDTIYSNTSFLFPPLPRSQSVPPLVYSESNRRRPMSVYFRLAIEHIPWYSVKIFGNSSLCGVLDGGGIPRACGAQSITTAFYYMRGRTLSSHSLYPLLYAFSAAGVSFSVLLYIVLFSPPMRRLSCLREAC